jgi:tetratricopeptide (TPR) repeat protein
VLARRSTPRQSREALVVDVRTRGERDGDAIGPPTAGLAPAARAEYLGRLVEDYAEIVAMSEEEARSVEARRSDPAQAGSARVRREALLRDARQYQEQIVRTVQNVVEIAPSAANMDLLLFRAAVALSALSRDDDALRMYRALLQRFPQSPYVPHTYLAFAGHFFAQREWEPAVQFYERARLPADATNHARAYALYRLAWARLLSGSFAAALARFDETLAWANDHPDAPDIVRLAAVTREEREVAAWATAPERTVAATRSAPEADARREAMAQAADVLQAAGDWRGAVTLYRRLLAQHSLDARYCAWRAAAARAMDCLVAPPR